MLSSPPGGNLPQRFGRSTDVVFGDVDRDGDLVFQSSTRPTRLYRNDGRGRFTDATAGSMPPGGGSEDTEAVQPAAAVDKADDPGQTDQGGHPGC